MGLTPYFHWRFKIGSGAKKYHFAASVTNESGRPLTVTLCGKVYDPANRIDASKGLESLTGDECGGCLKKLFKSHKELRDVLIQLGKSEDDAARIAANALELRAKD